MRRIIFILSIALILCGCSKNINENKYANFKHYSLEGYEKEIYRYIDEDKNQLDVYAIANMKLDGESYNNVGLFYLIDDNDYILLEEFNDIYSPQSKQYIFNNNKLYVLKSAAVVFEYTLDKEKISTKELNFKYDNSFIYEFLSVNDNYISIEAAPANFGEDREHYKLECNFKTLDCEKLPLE